MPCMIEVRGAHKNYGDQVLLDDASVQLYDDRKVGMIGRNGAGKSTLARILLGQEDLDHGEIKLHKNLRLGYLHQHDPFEPGETVLEYLLRESSAPDWKCGEVAGSFQIKGDDLTGPVTNLSGGWQSRVKLAAVLLHDPNLLILDEPTNFLDLSTQILLESFLRNFNGGCLVISHDRAFLRATCDHTIELSRGKIFSYPCGLEDYLEQKEIRIEHDKRSNEKNLSKRKQLQKFINKNRAGANTASQARSKQKQLDRLSIVDEYKAESTASIRLPLPEVRSGTAFLCDELSIGYEDLTVASKIRLDFEHGQRIAVVGDNGQGKTTFLRTIIGSIEPISGECKWGFGCELGVYAQHVYSTLPDELTVQQYLTLCASSETTVQEILNVAGSFLFRAADTSKTVLVLSGGERARLCLAGLFLKGHNVLIMDEPANHLDVETSAALAKALSNFAGTVIFTTHDRDFMSKVATRVVEVRAGRVENYPGDYYHYLANMKSSLDDTPVKPKPAKKNSSRNKYQLEKDVSALERKISKQQEAIAEIAEKMFNTTDDWEELADLQKQQQKHESVVAELEGKWCELHEQLEGL